MTLKLYNTLTREKELFKPLEAPNAMIYNCGPTVYGYIHIGNLRAFLFADILRRYLEYAGYTVTQIMNLTDVDDKTVKNALAQNVTLEEYTKPFIDAFFEDTAAVGIEKATRYPRATDHIGEMIRIIGKLEEGGHTYEDGGTVFFDISTFPAYGALSKLDFSHVKSGARDAVRERLDSDEYEKKDVRDFALWKAAKESEQAWDSPWGRGRPGWHIECSAMSSTYLGDTFDIHTGGVDNMFPHHENEIAQSEAASGKQFVRYWLHCEHLLVDNEKMSKSKGNFYTVRDVFARGHSPKALRYALVSAHYRKKLNFTWPTMEHAAKTVARYCAFAKELNALRSGATTESDAPGDAMRALIETAERGFADGMDNDLDTPAAFAAVFQFMHGVNKLIAEERVTPADAQAAFAALERFDHVIGLLDDAAIAPDAETLPDELMALIDEREEARKAKDWARADALRDALKEKGITLQDTKHGVRWSRE